MKPELGVCYYPEHWPEDRWAVDAAKMVETGISWVRIGEFAWSRLEPSPGNLRFEWLDRAIETLGSAGLKVVLGTPTATPPRWMVSKHPDMLAIDAEGRPRKFGSRRHYCFSHKGYRRECQRIAGLLGERYGDTPAIQAWQIDNEYGCHDTIHSYSDAATTAFRDWLNERYGSVEALNNAWGNVFWSMEYSAFDDIDLPNLTVTEPNPAHVMAFRRFASDEVVAFNRAQTEELRKHTDRPLIHNYMGRILEFDHYDVAADLDIASWDSYPLGFLLDRVGASEENKLTFLRQGDPDFQAFHHDLYRCVGNGCLWVMEQQPGPVNWAPNKPAPLPGMVRLWTWEAIAHGAEVVSYFRWRQLAFGQEQMHSGLLAHDGSETEAISEVKDVACELSEVTSIQSPVAIVFDYASDWTCKSQPQGENFDYFALCFSAYRALRRAGMSVDIVGPDQQDFSGYKLVLAPGLATVPACLKSAIEQFDGISIFGPRAGSKTEEMSIPSNIPLGVGITDLKIKFVETLPDTALVPAKISGSIVHWLEKVETNEPVQIVGENGDPILIGGKTLYLAGWPDDELWDRIVAFSAEKVCLPVEKLPGTVRIRDIEGERFVFNYGKDPVAWAGQEIAAAGVLILQARS